MKKRVAITGHTDGIGKNIYNTLKKSKQYLVSGYSLDNDYNIEDSQKIINACIDDDIFINNAFDGWSQVDLLYKLYTKWQDQNKTIINIGSVTSDTKNPVIERYQIQKKALENACKQLQPLGKCKVTNIKLGWVDSPMMDPWLKKADLPKDFKILKPKNVSEIILYILNQPKNICIKEIAIEPWPSRVLFNQYNPTAKGWLE
tara:strand:- start:844 stop:1449 length:606 start_codon:yes stop_codon:yes gene_type:complete